MARNHQFSSPQPNDWMRGKVVGSGAYGTVHLGMSKETGALFVVKSAQSGTGLESLDSEAKILESLNSPYVIRCMGRNLSNGTNGKRQLNLFMEYMSGGSLSDVAEKFGGILDEKVIRLYTREILQGLKYLHNNGIVHCDLKCKNVLLGSSGNIKLADFGCAKRPSTADSKTTNGASSMNYSWESIGGTPLWMAPEVLRNEGLGFASDIWSLGCTVVEMATGRPPWSDDHVSNPMAAVLKIACGNEKPQFPIQFSKEGLDFLGKCLERNPRRRWRTEELLNHPFVSRNSSAETNSTKEDAFSPSSVLDINGIINEEVGYESDELHGNEFSSRIPFSTRCCCGNQMRRVEMQQAKSDLASSESWVTVRSSGRSQILVLMLLHKDINVERWI